MNGLARLVLVKASLLALVFELVTVVLRFGCGLRAGAVTAPVGKLTGGLRIHHAYVGVLISALVVLAGKLLTDTAFVCGLASGLGLVASDLAHHFIVLWAVTGSHEFHIFYEQGK